MVVSLQNPNNYYQMRLELLQAAYIGSNIVSFKQWLRPDFQGALVRSYLALRITSILINLGYQKFRACAFQIFFSWRTISNLNQLFKNENSR